MVVFAKCLPLLALAARAATLTFELSKVALYSPTKITKLTQSMSVRARVILPARLGHSIRSKP